MVDSVIDDIKNCPVSVFSVRDRWTEGYPEKLIAGMLVQTETEGFLLVGHVNEVGGDCACCVVAFAGNGTQPFKDILRWIQLVKMPGIPSDD